MAGNNRIVRLRGHFLGSAEKFVVDWDVAETVLRTAMMKAAKECADQSSLAGKPVIVTHRSIVTVAPHGLRKFYQPRSYQGRK